MLQERRQLVDSTSTTSSSVSTEASVSTEIHMRSKLELVESYYEDAKKMVQRALKSDEKGDRMNALELYNQSLSTLQSGLKFIKSTQMMNSALYEFKDKMNKLKGQVKTRMSVLLSEEEHAKSKSSTTTSSASSVSGLVTEGRGRGGGAKKQSGAEADVLYTISTGIKVFRISSQGEVSNCTSTDSISVFRYRNKIPGQPPGFLQCGDFVYPLVPGKSPILRSSKKAYMFPDVSSDGEAGNSVGLLIQDIPSDEMEELNHVLSTMSDMQVSKDSYEASISGRGTSSNKEDSNSDDKPVWGSNISEKLDAGVSWISGVISKGTDKGEDLLTKGGKKARDNIEPREEPVNVPVPIERGAHYTRKATGVVVGVSDFLMTTLAKGTVMVGKKVGSAIAESDMVKETEINPHALEAWKVTKSTVKGTAHVFSDLEKGARTMIRTAGKETSKTAGHKYGNEVGKVTDDSLVSAGHVADLASTYWNWKTWGISFISKVGKVLSDGDKETTQVHSTTAVPSPVRPPPPTSSVTMTTHEPSIKNKSTQHHQPQQQVTTKEKEVLYA